MSNVENFRISFNVSQKTRWVKVEVYFTKIWLEHKIQTAVLPVIIFLFSGLNRPETSQRQFFIRAFSWDLGSSLATCCLLLQRINAEQIMAPAAQLEEIRHPPTPPIKLPTFNDIHLGIISGSIFISRLHKQRLSAQELSLQSAVNTAAPRRDFTLYVMSEEQTRKYLFDLFLIFFPMRVLDSMEATSIAVFLPLNFPTMYKSM